MVVSHRDTGAVHHQQAHAGCKRVHMLCARMLTKLLYERDAARQCVIAMLLILKYAASDVSIRHTAQPLLHAG